MKSTFLFVLLILTFGCQPMPTPAPVPPIQPAAPTSIPANPGNQVLLIAKETSENMQLMLTQEVGVMISIIEKAGFKVVIASRSGQPITGGAATLKPDLKLADVRVEDYAGIIIPCMASIEIAADAVEIVKKATALGKPIAAQVGGVLTLGRAGILSGKQFATFSDYERYVRIPDGTYKGEGIVQDGNIITSGTCPNSAISHGTAELTQKFIALLKSVR